mgnify:CR=1 FL=1
MDKGVKEPKIKHVCLRIEDGEYDSARNQTFGKWGYGVDIVSQDKSVKGYIKNCISFNGDTLILCELVSNRSMK